MLHKRAYFIFISLLIWAIPLAVFSAADDLEIKVTKLAQNFYTIDGKPLLIQTRNCDTTNTHQNPFLKINDRSKTIHFRQPEGQCAVKAAYKLSGDGVGSYSVIIWHEADNWYAIANTDSYIRTKECPSRAQGQKAVLSLKGAHGALLINQTECRVAGVYTKIE